MRVHGLPWRRILTQLQAERLCGARRIAEREVKAEQDTVAALGQLADHVLKESARLQALQVQQQLGAQALGIANQAPQIILSLFRS